jgi:hypothetical protein
VTEEGYGGTSFPSLPEIVKVLLSKGCRHRSWLPFPRLGKQTNPSLVI